MNRLPFILVCAVSLLAPRLSEAQTMAAPDRLALRDLQALVELHEDPKSLVDVAQGHPVAWVHGRAMVGFLGRLNEGVSEGQWRDWVSTQPYISAGSCREGIASFRVDAYQLSSLESLPMSLVELASRAVPHLNKARYGTRVDSVHAGLNLPQSFHGEGVLIGVLDWGFDYTHPMFYDTTLTVSRIRAVWDQYRQAGPSPGAYGYGTEAATPWEIQLLESDTSNVYGYSTHGTHVAGIAGGSGAGIGLMGMAPAAEFVFATLMVDEAAALDAFEWMAGVAEADGKRLVINNSWGLPQWGVPDGTGLSNQFIDALSAEGVVFVSSNGNNGDSDFHLDHTFGEPGDTIRSRVQFYPLSANPNAWGQNLTLWGEPGQSFSAGFLLTQGISNVVGASPMYATSDGPLVLDTIQVANGDTIMYDVAMEAAHPSNGRPFLQMRVRKGSSNLAVVLQATAESGHVHAWNHTHLSNDVGNWGQDFQAAQPSWLGGDPFYGVQQPACGQTVIAVGAYSSEYLNSQGTEVGGSLANFSTHGPTLDERLKPNVSAPGVSVESSLSSFRDGNYAVTSTADFDGTTFEFAKLSGTSMSSPATAGVVALMLEANPMLSPGDVRAILEWTARQDDDTGSLPDEGDLVWGHGKVTASQAVRASLDWISWLELPTVAPPGLFIHPNPAQHTTYVDVPAMSRDHMPCHWRLLNTSGQTCLEGAQTLPMVLPLDGTPQGILMLQVRSADGDVWNARLLHVE
ncbi:MAG: S8 family serine peptidase [Bacteroidetes bacterium]|nr:S8 family serine peptidase [Bacteroidota bacterium]